LRENSTVIALSPLGRRRGGGSVAAMASVLPRDWSHGMSKDGFRTV
jgi:hypothetical protein